MVAIDKDLLWATALEALDRDSSDGRPRLAYNRIVPREITDDGTYFLAVPNVFNQNWIERNYIGLITQTVNDIAPYPLDVKIVVDESIVVEALNRVEPEVHHPAAVSQDQPTATQDRQPLFNPKLTFETFVAGDSNQFARNASLAVAEQPGLKYNPLFIWGGSGLGKTHLLQAIGNYVQENYPHKKLIYTPAIDFVDEFVSSLHGKGTSPEMFKNRYRAVDVLLIDDIQYLENKEQTIDSFFHIFNHLAQLGKQIVIAADRSPSQLNMDERYRSRFNSGLLVDIQPPPYEVRLAILQRYTQSQNFNFEPEALSYVAEKAPSNIREMEGVVNRISAWAHLSHRPVVTIEDVKVAASDLLVSASHKMISISAIQKEVCRYYSITHTELVGSKRKQEIVFPRHVAMFLSQELTDSSLPKIGFEFGGKDHTTVMHAAAKIKKMMTSDAEVFSQIEYLTKELRKKAL